MSISPKHELEMFVQNLVNSRHADLLDMLTDDAVIEFPYHLPTTPARLDGKGEIESFFAGFGDFLVLSEVRLIAAYETADENVGIVESEGKGTATKTGRPYTQHYVTVLTFRDGKICHWKDFWNPVRVLESNGDSVQAGV